MEKKLKQNFHWLILYDIRDVKRLLKVSKIIESYGWRVQKSVFESDADEKTIEILRKRLIQVIDIETDFVLFFDVCEKDFQKCEKFGKFEENKIMNDKFLIL